MFHSPNHPLPFLDHTFAIVHGLDTLHRYSHIPLIPECLRAAKNEGVIVFPHNHLTNSLPEPYFDRGEDQMHGKEYEQYFARLLQESSRRSFVLSEKTLFNAASAYTLINEAETEHYNGLILIIDRKLENRVFYRKAKQVDDYRDGCIVLNPLWKIDLTQGIAIPDAEAMDSGGGELFFRHPIYRDRMENHNPITLDETDRLIFYWAMRVRTLQGIASILEMPVAAIFGRILSLESKELLQIQNISPAMAALQSYYCTQEVPRLTRDATLSALWKRAVQLHAAKPMILWPVDDSVFTYQDADTIVRMAATFLKTAGVQRGDRIVIDAVSHPEFVILFWAAVLIGAVAVPVNPELKQEPYSRILARTRPALVFVDRDVRQHELDPTARTILFAVQDESEEYAGSFSAGIGECEPCWDFPDILEDQAAAILFTSGSTGDPKGVVLSHGGLVRSAGIIDRAYRWHSEDRFLGGGSFHTMSGLRNPCIAILHSGASVVIPGKENTQNPLSVMNLCMKYNVTILNVTPSFLAYWSVASQKAKFYQSHQLRMVLSTGSALQPLHREMFYKLFGVPIYDYYGLTETTGACILENEAIQDLAEKGIGRPWGCVVKIIGETGAPQPQDATGELAIYSDNLMLGYFGDSALTQQRIRSGWLMTGDTARLNDRGCVVLTGRKDRMMIDKNGENVYPEEIERVLCSIDGVNDAYVTQVRDEKQIDQIAAVVQVLNGNMDESIRISEVRTALESKIPPQHIPSFILPVAEIPRGASGKPSAAAIRELLVRNKELRSGTQE